MFEIMMGVMGDRRRWRTMPWMVTMFILIAVPLGIVSIYFISRLVFGTVPPLGYSDHLVGALVITVAVIATAEVGRAPLNVLFGVWLIIAPWLLSGGSAVAAWAGVVAGIALIVFGLSIILNLFAHFAPPREKNSDC
jgi:SPW repeat